MAISIQKGGNNHRRRRRLISEINVTPMVDVMLVLLIIFMITSPMLVAGIDVDLPETKAKPVSSDLQPLVIGINKKEEIFLLKTKIAPNQLVDKLKEITKEDKERRIFVKGDKNISYGKVVEIMALIQSAGFHKVALISDIEK